MIETDKVYVTRTKSRRYAVLAKNVEDGAWVQIECFRSEKDADSYALEVDVGAEQRNKAIATHAIADENRRREWGEDAAVD